MNIERMQRLSSFLRNEVPPERFDYRNWFAVTGRRFFLVGPVGGCRTVACALGWACAIPEFREAGLKVNMSQEPQFCGFTGVDAAAKFFGLQLNVAEATFGWDDAYPVARIDITPTMVADRIDELVAKELRTAPKKSATKLAKAAIAKAATNSQSEALT